MACNGCFKVYPNIKEHEEQCPSCGFSYCQKCLHYKIFVKILNTEENICKKCARCSLKGEIHRIPPPEYYKRIVSTASRKGKKKRSNV